jgi:4'-phosphopantetheinyl transferase
MTIPAVLPELVLHRRLDEAAAVREGAHAWLVDLDAPWPGAAGDEEVLEAEEYARAAQLRSPLARRRCERSRAIVRQLLAPMLREDPARIVFETTLEGRPFVRPREGDRSGFDFNLAHSENAILLGVCFGGTIGVDIEVIRDGFDVLAIAESALPPAEAAALRSLPAAERRVAFFRAWTRREAHVKATGRGLAGDGRDDPGDGWRRHEFLVPVGPATAAAAIVLEVRP